MRLFSNSSKLLCEQFAQENSLKYVLVDVEGIALNGSDYYIYFSLDREGVNMSYIDCKDHLVYGLDLFLFESRKARVPPFDPASGITPDDKFELSQLHKMLQGWGKDILAGGRLWIEEYPWKPRPVVATEIGKNREMFKFQ